jgi:hypothetical protein
MFSLLLSDQVGLERLWLLIQLFHALILLCLAILITENIQNTRSCCVAIGLPAGGTAVGAVQQVTVGGLCYQLFDYMQQVSAFAVWCLAKYQP